jgi:hypothetical protein
MADPLLAQSAIDRLQSAAYELILDGESYRHRQSQSSPRGPANHAARSRGAPPPHPGPPSKMSTNATGTFPARQHSLPQNPRDHNGARPRRCLPEAT